MPITFSNNHEKLLVFDCFFKHKQESKVDYQCAHNGSLTNCVFRLHLAASATNPTLPPSNGLTAKQILQTNPLFPPLEEETKQITNPIYIFFSIDLL